MGNLEERGSWIGVDLDGTLAYYDDTYVVGQIGSVIEPMKRLVLDFIDKGYEVKIFTARVYSGSYAGRANDVQKNYLAIKQWLKENGLPDLEITCVKDYMMVELYDDRAVQVEKNTGKLLGQSTLRQGI
ncbi:MAG: hypothetical protein QQN63_04105 [Nitrosopumilus sp.]